MPVPRRPASAEPALQELRAIGTSIAEAAARRDELIVEATKRGASVRVVAEAAGISYGRVQQIAAKARS